MSKPEDIPPEVRNTVLAILRDDNKGNLGVVIARAIMSAEKRGEERERAACLALVADDYGGFVPDTDHGVGYHRACQNLAAAIRKRGEG